MERTADAATMNTKVTAATRMISGADLEHGLVTAEEVVDDDGSVPADVLGGMVSLVCEVVEQHTRRFRMAALTATTNTYAGHHDRLVRFDLDHDPETLPPAARGQRPWVP